MAEYRDIYWDTSVFLCFLNLQEVQRRLICEDILIHAQNGAIHLYTSCYTIAEVIYPKPKSIPSSRRLTPTEANEIARMFQSPLLRLIEVDRRVATYAAELARDYSMSPADAVQAASALLWNLEVIQAWDRDFSSVGHLIAVAQPQYITKQTAFEGFAHEKEAAPLAAADVSHPVQESSDKSNEGQTRTEAAQALEAQARVKPPTEGIKP